MMTIRARVATGIERTTSNQETGGCKMWATILKFFGGSYVTMALVAALAGLLLTAYVQHKTNHALSMEVTAIKSQLSTAQDANRTDERSILEIQAGLATCTQQFAAAGVASAQA